MTRKLVSVGAVLAGLVALAPAWAQQPVPPAPPGPPAPPVPQRSVELSAGSQRLSAGFGNWRDITLRGVYGAGNHVWQGELSAHRRFGVSGTFASLGDTVTLNPDWFAGASLGVGSGAFYLPRLRADAFVARKWLPARNLVTSVGFGYYDAPDGHVDRSLSLGGAYYFEQPWVVQAGIRFNESDPGSISTTQQHVAVTYGREKKDVVTARIGWGREGYQAIAQNTRLVDFASREASLTWRHWFSDRWGFLIGAEVYRNPSYDRNGVQVGVFHQF